MEAPEVPTEHLHEEINEHSEHAAESGHGGREKWVGFVALSTAIIAALAAVASLKAAGYETLSMNENIHANDQWAYYQAKSIKSTVWEVGIEEIKSSGKIPDPSYQANIDRYKKEEEEIKAKAEGFEEDSREHLERHETLAGSVTMFQIAIAIAAISVLTKKRTFFFGSLGFAGVGLYFFSLGLLHHAAPAVAAAAGS